MSEWIKAQIEDFWQEYKKHIEKDENNDYLIKDGIDLNKINEYMEQAIKVLFVFKESNDRGNKKEKSLFDKGEWFGSFGNNRRDKKGISMCVKMYKYILAKKQGRDVDIYGLKVEPQDINKFAFINISKRGNGGDQSDDNYIKEIIKRDAQYLIRQIELLNPNVIVVGGKHVSGEFVKEIVEMTNLKDVEVIQIEHFRSLGYESINNNVERSFMEQCNDLKRVEK